ncbi:MAG TPA: homoserine kinase, partial [Anaerolineae bacterium]|nr:homoserine kinase [Anaerolineae bacterium]
MPDWLPMSGIRVVVPASTANLGAGFDVLAMALQLYLSLEVRPAEPACQGVAFRDGLSTELASAGAKVARDAMAVGLRLAGRDGLGYELQVESQIPLARGLGSSAALRVACLMAAGSMGESIPRVSLAQEAALLDGHPDNSTAALEGGLVVTASCSGVLRWGKLPVRDSLVAVLAIPDMAILTEQSRNSLPRTVPMADAVFNLGRTALFVYAIAQGRFDLLMAAMEDRLHQGSRVASIPGAAKAMEAAREAGAKGVALSGSGPSVLALCDRTEGKEGPVASAMA